jgi:hypothetical protein
LHNKQVALQGVEEMSLLKAQFKPKERRYRLAIAQANSHADCNFHDMMYWALHDACIDGDVERAKFHAAAMAQYFQRCNAGEDVDSRNWL